MKVQQQKQQPGKEVQRTTGKERKEQRGVDKKTKGGAAYVIVKVNEGWTCAEVLGKLRAEVGPAASITTILRPQPPKKGDVLLHLRKESDKAAFAAMRAGRSSC